MIDTSSKPKKKHEEEEKSAQEYYQAFNFDSSVRTFTDFLQARMTPQNQLILPNNAQLNEDTYHFYTQGKTLLGLEKTILGDLIEERVRNQLEQSDLL